MSVMLPIMTGLSSSARSQRSAPIIIDAEGTAKVLSAYPLIAGGKSEAWLQRLVHDYPSLLPINDIEPGIGIPVPVAMEVACAHGFIDNLYVTSDGDIIIVEAKLWSNPQARREVVAQTLDYIAALASMSYEAFQAAALKARGDGSASLYSLLPSPSLDEAEFIDAVSRNLRRSRILGIVLGDGIRDETRALIDLLQSHAGAHFTLALVQMTIWADGQTGQLIVVPDTLMQTVMIERGIVVIDDGIPKIVPVPISTLSSVKTMTSELFDEALAKKDSQLPGMLRSFLAQLAPLGVGTVQDKTLKLIAHVAGYDQPIRLGYITKNGQLWTENVHLGAPAAASMAYVDRLARMIDGVVTGSSTPYATTNGSSAPNVLALLRDQPSEWHEAIAQFIRDCETAVDHIKSAPS